MNYFTKFNLNPLFWFFGIVGAFAVVLLNIIIWLVWPESECKRIESDKLIIPKIELQIINNKVDTIYVYEFNNY